MKVESTEDVEMSTMTVKDLLEAARGTPEEFYVRVHSKRGENEYWHDKLIVSLYWRPGDETVRAVLMTDDPDVGEEALTVARMRGYLRSIIDRHKSRLDFNVIVSGHEKDGEHQKADVVNFGAKTAKSSLYLIIP